MSLYLAVLVVLVGGLATTQAASRCCVPSQWECILSQVGGVHVMASPSSSVFINTIQYSYDATNKRVALKINTNTAGKVVHSKIIQDFRARRQYTIVGKKCTYTKIPTAFKPSCVPANATYMGRYYLGTGSSKLTIDSWQMNVMQFRVFFSLGTDGKCIPITEVAYGQVAKVQEMVTMGFINPTIGIKDPKVFTPPSGCRPAHYKDTLYFKKTNPDVAKLSDYMTMRHSSQ